MIQPVTEKISELRATWPDADIWELLDRLGIVVDYQDLSCFGRAIKGYCFCISGAFYVILDSNLPPFLQALIAWHELGHICLDADLLLQGQVFFDDALSLSRMEKHANYFAAEGYIDDEQFLELVYEGYSIQQIAAELQVPRDFVLYKAEILRAYDVPLQFSETSNALCLQDDIYG